MLVLAEIQTDFGVLGNIMADIDAPEETLSVKKRSQTVRFLTAEILCTWMTYHPLPPEPDAYPTRLNRSARHWYTGINTQALVLACSRRHVYESYAL
jgi:hypothetical protein